jgi:hypothetical protein
LANPASRELQARRALWPPEGRQDEIKFTDGKVGLEVTREVERKLEIFPNPMGRTIERVLISASEPSRQLRDEGYFNEILGLDLFF